MKTYPCLLALLVLVGLAKAQEPDFHPKRFDRTRFAMSATFLALQGIDAGATEAGFRGATTAHPWLESNPLVPHSTAGRMSYFAATGAGILYASHLAASRGHRKLSLLILGAGIAVEGYAATHSLIGLQK